MPKVAAIAFAKLLVCYLLASSGLLLYSMWPHYRTGEMLSALIDKPWLLAAALPATLFVPSMEGNDRFVGSLLTFVAVFAVSAAYAFWPRGKTPNTALLSDTFTSPLRAQPGAAKRER